METESSLKMVNAFSFSLKLFWSSKYLNFSTWLFGQVENGLIRKVILISKFITSQPGKQTIAIQILIASRSKDNRAVEFGWLIECNMRNIFLEKSYTKFSGETECPDPFLKDQNWEHVWINSLKSHTVCFYCIPSW